MIHPMPFHRRTALPLFASAALAATALTSSAAFAAPEKYALSMLHFNVQYVAGGLRGFFTTPDPTLDLSADEVENRIVRESFEPVLDIFLAHPAWGANIEMQGYMLEVLAARHADVLDKLRKLAKSGQIEVTSFHYSDQLFMAHAPDDWQRSAERNKATFATLDVPLSGAVFCQEGQAGPGMAARMAEHGYSTLVWPKNLFSYQHGPGPRAPLYRFGDVNMITSDGADYDDGTTQIQTTFWFVDDGELLATGDYDPYIAEHFKTDPEAIAKTIDELSNLEKQGFSITTVGKYITAIQGRVAIEEPPPLLDGTWQPDSTDGIFRWLGGHGIWWLNERDNDVRTLASLAHRELLSAETAAAAAGIDASEEIDGGFRLLALAEVSDASGINPFRGEIEYGLGHASEALRIARDVIVRSKEALGQDAIRIDTDTGTVTHDTATAVEPAPIDAPMDLVITAGDRTTDVTWLDLGDGVVEARIHFGLGDERLVSVTFPGELGDIVYTPGLAEAPVHAARDAFVFEHYELALPDGLIGLGPDRFLVKDQAWVHIAARITRTSGDVELHDTTMPSGEETTWVVRVVQGDETFAAAVARRLNLRPEVVR
jgi:hypothetical protein